MIGRPYRDSTLDEALDALAHPYRRELLVALLLEHPQADAERDLLDVFDDAATSDRLQSELYHRHLPKLESSGYIEWDRQSKTVSKGPNWDRIAPLTTLIHDHRETLVEGSS